MLIDTLVATSLIERVQSPVTHKWTIYKSKGEIISYDTFIRYLNSGWTYNYFTDFIHLSNGDSVPTLQKVDYTINGVHEISTRKFDFLELDLDTERGLKKMMEHGKLYITLGMMDFMLSLNKQDNTPYFNDDTIKTLKRKMLDKRKIKSTFLHQNEVTPTEWKKLTEQVQSYYRYTTV